MKKQHKHPLHIVTNKKIIMNQVKDFAYDIDCGLIYCIINHTEDNCEYERILYSVCWKLHMIARLVYKTKNGICKLAEDEYRREIFETLVETPDEVAIIIKRLGGDVSKDFFEHAYKCLNAIANNILKSIANVGEIVKIHELANMIDYVMRRNSNILELKDGETFGIEWDAFGVPEKDKKREAE